MKTYAGAQQMPINNGPFKPTDESLKQYKYPEWFRDAKFGIWAHWGPQAVPRQGDWYARNMYEEGSRQNIYHVANYGTPSKFGYKDIIPLWKAEKWNPEKLMALYKRAGAKYFVSMGSHHDNFFLWNSKIHRWNSVNMGPHKDVVGLWQKAAKNEGLKFGVSEHLAASYTWYQSAHRADTAGPYKGVPYDGADPQYADLYHTKAAPGDNGWLTTNPEWMKEWYNDVKELVDTYHPDLLYSDSKLPFDEVGRSMLANFYNGNIAFHNGQPTAVYNCKEASEGKWAQDVERGVLDSISPYPWQTDTSIGDWYYRTGQKYKTGTEVIQMLLDIVSKNGNLLINVVQTPEGDLEPDVLNIVEEIAAWMPVNGEGIYGTRPWKIYGEGPSTIKANQAKGTFGGLSDTHAYQATDIRFTTKGNVLYAFCMDKPQSDIRITSLGKKSKINNKTIAGVKLLGSDAKLQWRQEDDALIITCPKDASAWRVRGLKVELK
ncbi:alpha-L-fucosidase [Mucilaginibacter flavus]|uniref:alpha-L-fucosidase n=1 Tax=Mucilaginibacter flavus TaxID=931504 RepID=UPI0025B59D3A|nr:alpha-L-fucosidase [Mucilaginibacter flavus]